MSDAQEQLSPLEERERDELDRAYREVFKLAAGKRVLFDILEQCAIYREAFAGDNNVTNFTLGLQAGGRKLIARLDGVDPRLYPTLLLDMADIKALDLAAAKNAADKMEKEDDE